MDCVRVSMVDAGDFWTKMSPLVALLKAYSTRSSASSRLIMKRVIAGSVIVIGSAWRIWLTIRGITEPRVAMTFP